MSYLDYSRGKHFRLHYMEVEPVKVTVLDLIKTRFVDYSFRNKRTEIIIGDRPKGEFFDMSYIFLAKVKRTSKENKFQLKDNVYLFDIKDRRILVQASIHSHLREEFEDGYLFDIYAVQSSKPVILGFLQKKSLVIQINDNSEYGPGEHTLWI